MEWTQTITLGVTLIAYMTGMCIFLYRLNEKSIQEWRDEHKSQLEKNEARQEKIIKEWRDEHRTQLEKNENRWAEMFKQISVRLDKVVEKP